MLPLRDRVDLGVMARKGYSIFLKTSALLKPHYQIFIVISRTLVVGEFYPAKEMQLVYSVGPANRVKPNVSGDDSFLHSNDWPFCNSIYCQQLYANLSFVYDSMFKLINLNRDNEDHLYYSINYFSRNNINFIRKYHKHTHIYIYVYIKY